MAFPMVHLIAARNWAARRGQYLDDPAFYLGAIAPDAIHMREGCDRALKQRVHLLALKERNPQRVADYWARHSSSFDIGYGIHVLTDLYWVSYYVKRYPQILDEAGHTIAELYYPDCNAIDDQLYTEHPDRPTIFNLIEQAVPPKNHPLLTPQEIDGWAHRITHSFNRKLGPFQTKIMLIEDLYRFTYQVPDDIDQTISDSLTSPATPAPANAHSPRCAAPADRYP